MPEKTLAQQLEDLKALMTTRDQEIVKLTARVTELEPLAGQAKDLTTKVADLTTSNTALTGKVSDLETKLAAETKRAGELETRAKTAEASNDKTTKILELNPEVAALFTAGHDPKDVHGAGGEPESPAEVMKAYQGLSPKQRAAFYRKNEALFRNKT